MGPSGLEFLSKARSPAPSQTTEISLATPVGLFLPLSSAQPSIMVTSIGGVAVPPSPTGSFTVPDVALNSNSPLTINIPGHEHSGRNNRHRILLDGKLPLAASRIGAADGNDHGGRNNRNRNRYLAAWSGPWATSLRPGPNEVSPMAPRR